jgi:hypothetical protein
VQHCCKSECLQPLTKKRIDPTRSNKNVIWWTCRWGLSSFFVRGCKPLWFAAVLHQIFFLKTNPLLRFISVSLAVPRLCIRVQTKNQSDLRTKLFLGTSDQHIPSPIPRRVPPHALTHKVDPSPSTKLNTRSHSHSLSIQPPAPASRSAKPRSGARNTRGQEEEVLPSPRRRCGSAGNGAARRGPDRRCGSVRLGHPPSLAACVRRVAGRPGRPYKRVPAPTRLRHRHATRRRCLPPSLGLQCARAGKPLDRMAPCHAPSVITSVF